jgi:hypothetical protein
MKRFLCPLILGAILFAAAPAGAQTIGTFRWQLSPLGSVLNLTVTQQGSLFLIHGTEEQCGGNLSLPVTGLAVPQANGQIFIGVTSINETGRGIHTRAYVNLTDFNGTWADNTGYFNQPFLFNPGTTCPGGLRTDPNSGDTVPK